MIHAAMVHLMVRRLAKKNTKTAVPQIASPFLRLRKPRKLGPKRGTSAKRRVEQPARFKNDIWTCDFIHEQDGQWSPPQVADAGGRIYSSVTVLHADNSITGADVRRIVARVIGRRGAPSRIRSDNGSEFICEALVNWLPGVGAASIPVAAGSPWENGYIESFHSRLFTNSWSVLNSRMWQMPERRRLVPARI